MQDLSARTVIFVKDAERSLSFYTGELGFALDWTQKEKGRAYVVQVSLFGFQLILNQTEPWTDNRVGNCFSGCPRAKGGRLEAQLAGA